MMNIKQQINKFYNKKKMNLRLKLIKYKILLNRLMI